jgi:hypothetical protein
MKIEKLQTNIKLILEFENYDEFKEFKTFIHEFSHCKDNSIFANNIWKEIKHILN